MAKSKTFSNSYAHQEGWTLQVCWDRWDIQRLIDDPQKRFSCDFEAQCFVKDKADAGSIYHQLALEMHLSKVGG